MRVKKVSLALSQKLKIPATLEMSLLLSEIQNLDMHENSFTSKVRRDAQPQPSKVHMKHTISDPVGEY